MFRHAGLAPLSRQHHHGLALCVTVRRELAGGRSPEQLSRAAERIVRAYDAELADHFRQEEQLLSPLLNSPVSARVEQEHRELESLVEQLRSMPENGAIDEFVALLESHIRFEEREWFENLQKAVDDNTLNALGAMLERGTCPTKSKP